MSGTILEDAIQSSEGFSYYRDIIYWNDFPQVVAYMNTALSGSADEGWVEYVRRRYGCARRVFLPNCGNGWVEREMISKGAATSAVGADISDALLQAAQDAGREHGLDVSYHKMDSNDLDLAGMDFDWIVNFAAFHHIAFLDRALRRMLEAMPEDGLLIGFDYTGPHRNQYDWEMWRRVIELNHDLPAAFQNQVTYPHLRTMIHTDPTEAIHSELILDHVQRYFEILELSAVGGAIAYPLLYENRALFEAQATREGTSTLDSILAADAAYTDNRTDRSLFTFWVAKPKKRILEYRRQLALWTQEEAAREARAMASGMRYHAPGALEIIYEEIARLRSSA